MKRNSLVDLALVASRSDRKSAEANLNTPVDDLARAAFFGLTCGLCCCVTFSSATASSTVIVMFVTFAAASSGNALSCRWGSTRAKIS